MKKKTAMLSIAPFLVMFAVTIAAGRYSSIVSQVEGHGAKGAYGYDFVIIVALVIVGIAIVAGTAYGVFASRKKPGR
jgi:hypothetical protein